MSEKSKWFDRRPVSIELLSAPTERITPERLDLLLAELDMKRADEKIKKLFRHLACLSPSRRLLVNMSTLLKVAGDSKRGTVLESGLTASEKDALTEIQLRGYSHEAVVAAHGLLNISERETTLRFARSLVALAQSRNDAIIPRPNDCPSRSG